MAYVGNTPTTQNFISGTDYFNGTGSQTAFTLSRTVASVNDIQAVVNNVVQVPNDAYTISGTTITFTSAPSAGTQNVYVRYLSTTTQAITPSQNTVSWNTLDSNIQQDLGVMYKNRIINGNMVIDQRNAGASVNNTTATDYTLDRWNIYGSASAKFSCQRNAGSVTPPAGFTNYLGITSLAATSSAATDEYIFQQYIEGFNIADLNWGTANAQTVTLSFWVRSSLTGTFGGALANNNNNRFYPFSFAISSSNTWEKKSITIVGETTGTWLTTNGTGIRVKFNLGTGSSYLQPAGAWTTSFANGPTGATSVVGTNGATFYLTGVQLEVGTQATAFSTAGGSYGAELALCQRYFWQTPSNGGSAGVGFALATGGSTFNRAQIPLPVRMRAVPTTVFNNINMFNNATSIVTATASGSYSTVDMISMDGTTSGTTTPNGGSLLVYLASGSSYVSASAEL